MALKIVCIFGCKSKRTRDTHWKRACMCVCLFSSRTWKRESETQNGSASPEEFYRMGAWTGGLRSQDKSFFEITNKKKTHSYTDKLSETTEEKKNNE